MASSGGGGGAGKKRSSNLPITQYFSKMSRTAESQDHLTQGISVTVGGDQPNATSLEPAQSSAIPIDVDVESGGLSYACTNYPSPSSSASASEPLLSSEYPSATPSTSVNTPGSPPIVATPTSFKENIGHYVGRVHLLDNDTKRMLIENPWKPPVGYSFPFSEHMKKGVPEKRFVRENHLNDFHWLVFSPSHQGLYCTYCVLFADKYEKGAQAQNLVKTPLKTFAKLTGETGDVRHHEKCNYHVNALLDGQEFLGTICKPEIDIANQLDSQRLADKLDFAKRIRPIVETVMFAGRYNLPLRGHQDDGKVTPEEPAENDGTFRGLLRLRMRAGDETLKNHLETASVRSTHTSKIIQNEIIDLCREEIQADILKNVRATGMYAVIFDETTDVSNKEQLSLSLRYVYENSTHEDFFTFVDAYQSIRDEDVDCDDEENAEKKLNGKALAGKVVDLLEKSVLPLDQCVGVGTDNCSVMASEVKGAVKEIQKVCPNALRCPCHNHALNNSLCKTAKVVPVRNSIGVMKKVIAFANASANTGAVFRKCLGRAFSGLCETRWQEKHDGAQQFKTNLSNIVDARTIISNWTDMKASSDAICLIKALCDSEFIMATFAMCNVLEVTRPLSLELQSASLELTTANNLVSATVGVLQKSRSNADEQFSTVFKQASKLCEDLGVEVKTPRVIGRQKHRENQPASSPEEYYRKSVYIPLLDNILNDMQDRLPEETLNAFQLKTLLPSSIVALSDTDFSKEIALLSDRHAGFLKHDADKLEGDAKIYRKMCIRKKNDSKEFPFTALDASSARDTNSCLPSSACCRCWLHSPSVMLQLNEPFLHCGD